MAKGQKPLGKKAMAKAIEFVEEYLTNGRNGTRAYLKVFTGITNPDTAAVLATRLLKNAHVSVYLEQREQEIRAKYRLTTDHVIKSLSQALHFDPAKLYNSDGSLKQVTDLDEDTRMALAGMEVVGTSGTAKIGGEDGVALSHVPMFTKKFKWLDKNTAREQAMKHLGMFEKNNQQVGEAIRSIIVPAKAKRDGAAKA